MVPQVQDVAAIAKGFKDQLGLMLDFLARPSVKPSESKWNQMKPCETVQDQVKPNETKWD